MAVRIDFSRLAEQPGDRDPVPVFSFMGDAAQHPRQLPCWITHTNERTHEIIRSGFDRSPMFTGVIEGTGPRYCPSIEDKVNRFADKSAHQIFLEPEGLDTHEIYPNGISTSLPFDIQIAAVRSMVGLENADILRPGYAIEYDYFDPRELQPSFETRAMRGLFFAGQINGTTGYEEAAAQGLFAGVNAALQVQGREPLLLRRDQAYLGVLVDDLVSKGVTEPYRMFTSRAEYRLQLREDNADLRLTELGRQLGLVDDARWAAFERKREAIARETERLKRTWVHPGRCRRPTPSGCWARRWSMNTACSTCCAGRGSASTRCPRWRASPARRRWFHVKHWRRSGAPAWPMRSSSRWKSPPSTPATSTSRAKTWPARCTSKTCRLPPDLDYSQVTALSFEVRQKLTPPSPRRRWGRPRASPASRRRRSRCCWCT